MAPIVIAHRGASGYLPEHTLEAKRLAHEMGADYLEQDVVATADDELVVLHDIFLDRVTDVATAFEGRQRDDGRYYVRDFRLDELKQLRVWERFDADGKPVYPQRYPARTGEFRINTLAEELQFVAELNAGSQHVAGVYPEIKRPAWHRAHGVDIGSIMRDVLMQHGYKGRDDLIFVQCFDAAENWRLRKELDYPWRLIQLIADNAWNESATDYVALLTREGMAEIAGIVDGIGPWLPQLYTFRDESPESGDVIADAHELGLEVHPYTYRRDDLPPGFDDFDELVRFSVEDLGVDGLFTDFPDLVAKALGRQIIAQDDASSAPRTD